LKKKEYLMKKGNIGILCALVAFSSLAVEVDVMSFNIRYGSANDGVNKWEARKNLVFDVIRENAPDVVGLQEALRFQIDEIREGVSGYGEIGEGREGGELGEYSAILYNQRRFDAADSGTFWLSDTPEVPSRHWGNTCIRICTWVRLMDRETKTAFYHYNTHLDHMSQTSRERSVRLIAQRIRERQPNDPYVLTGDFNAGEDNPAILYLKGGDPADTQMPLLMVDTFRVLYPQEKTVGTFNGFKGVATGDKIDYIFVSPGVNIISAEILRPPQGQPCPSDHFPIKAELQF
jgi:endonuclease/exonuclease/phosphatase family metal-dependent hydrolase